MDKAFQCCRLEHFLRTPNNKMRPTNHIGAGGATRRMGVRRATGLPDGRDGEIRVDSNPDPDDNAAPKPST